MGYTNVESGPIPDAVAGVLAGPADVDVGLLMLTPEAESTVRAQGLPLAAVAEPSEASVLEDDYTVIAGFPDQLFRRDGRQINIASICYTTPVRSERDSRGRYMVSWDKGVAEESAWLVHREPGEVFELPQPFGISGGALWRFRGSVAKNHVWTPASIGRLIGVPSAWDCETTEFVEPVDRWGDWLRTACAVVDAGG